MEADGGEGAAVRQAHRTKEVEEGRGGKVLEELAGEPPSQGLLREGGQGTRGGGDESGPGEGRRPIGRDNGGEGDGEEGCEGRL